MATSPNYAWAEPDNSSLVKNGASDIRTLGDAIDTSLWNVGFGQAGKNKIINGDFGIWQRSTSATISADGTYYAPDRFFSVWNAGGATGSWTQQSFTPATAPVSGYEGTFFSRTSATSGGASTQVGLGQKIENVRTFAGQTATFSFWAKADSARTATLNISQRFGSGGSANNTVLSTTQALTTSWVRYSFNVSFSSVSGKTIGSSSFNQILLYLDAASGSPQLDTWGWQLEYGSKATPFQTATGTIQGELAACQRYYYNVGAGVNKPLGSSLNESTTITYVDVYAPVTMRTAPTIVQTTGASYYLIAGSNQSGFTGIDQSTNTITELYLSTSGLTQGQARLCRSQNASGSISLSAEL